MYESEDDRKLWKSTVMVFERYRNVNIVPTSVPPRGPWRSWSVSRRLPASPLTPPVDPTRRGGSRIYSTICFLDTLLWFVVLHSLFYFPWLRYIVYVYNCSSDSYHSFVFMID